MVIAATNASVSTAASNAVTSGSNAASTAETNATAAGQLAGLNAATSASNAQTTANSALNGVTAINNTTSSLENPTTFTPTSAAGSGNGLHLGSDKMGYIFDSTWKTYMDNSGNFYLGGDSNGALSWNNSTDQLVITGSIFAENGIFSGVVSGSQIQGGNITIGGGNFAVNSDGFLSASDASIGGTINSTDATLGAAWIVDADRNYF